MGFAELHFITNADACKDQCKTSGVLSPGASGVGLTCDHDGEGEALLHRLAVHLAGQRGKADILLVLVLLGTHLPLFSFFNFISITTQNKFTLAI